MILRPKPEVRNDGNSSGPRKLRPQIKILRYRRCVAGVDERREEPPVGTPLHDNLGSWKKFGGRLCAEQYPQELVGDLFDVVRPLEHNDILL
jgi:hypothetical protein